MIPSKRARYDMAEASPERGKSLQGELEMMKSEVEPVNRQTSMDSNKVTYRPTYRALLAERGFLVKQTLGSGSYSKVKFAFCFGRGDREKVAVKIVDRSKAPKDFQQRFLPREMSIWPRLSHPNIIRHLMMFNDKKRIYMILEFAENGDVLRYIQKVGALDEGRARKWTGQITDAVRYLHEQDITHRDLKLENLLMDRNYQIKICDFGFVKEDISNDLSKTYCGSKSYAAPEILKGQPYDPKKSDVWALGVILYIFVTGKMPFDESKGNHGILEDQAKLNFPWAKFKKPISDVCRGLILRMFTYEYANRPDIFEIFTDDWFNKELKSPDESPKKIDTPSRIPIPITRSQPQQEAPSKSKSRRKE